MHVSDVFEKVFKDNLTFCLYKLLLCASKTALPNQLN